jgi:hypothetical protein
MHRRRVKGKGHWSQSDLRRVIWFTVMRREKGGDLKSRASDVDIQRMKAIIRRLLVRCWEGPPDLDAILTTRGTTIVGPKTTRRELLKADRR